MWCGRGAWIQRVMSESLVLQSVQAGSFLLVTNQCRDQQNYVLNRTTVDSSSPLPRLCALGDSLNFLTRVK